MPCNLSTGLHKALFWAENPFQTALCMLGVHGMEFFFPSEEYTKRGTQQGHILCSYDECYLQVILCWLGRIHCALDG